MEGDRVELDSQLRREEICDVCEAGKDESDVRGEGDRGGCGRCVRREQKSATVFT